MLPIFSSMDTAVQQSFGLGSVLPPSISWPLSIFTRVHWYWRTKKDIQDLTESDEAAVSFAAGFVVNKAIGQDLLGTLYAVPAHLIDIGVKFQECVDQYRITSEAYRDGVSVLTGRKTFYIKNKGFSAKSYSLVRTYLDPSTRLWMHVQFQLLVIRVGKSVKYSILFLREAFTLSNHIMLLRDALTFDEASGQRAKNRFFLNIRKFYGRNHNPQDPNSPDKKAQLKQVLRSAGSPYVDQVDSALSKIEAAITPIQPIADALSHPQMKDGMAMIAESAKDLLGKMICVFWGDVPQPLLNSKKKNITEVSLSAILKTPRVLLPLKITKKEKTQPIKSIEEIQKKMRHQVWKFHDGIGGKKSLDSHQVIPLLA